MVRLMLSTIICMRECGHIGLPVRFLFRLKRPEHIKQGTIETFDLPVSHRMVWCCPSFLDPSHLTQMIALSKLRY